MMKPIEIIDKYYFHNPELREVLIIHSQQVRDRALKIVKAHPELNADAEFIAQAAMLHDIGIIFCNAPKIHCHGNHKYIEHGYLGAELLRKEGLPLHAGVAERHTGSGITKEQVIREDLPLPVKDYCPQTIEEEIICYADKFYSKSHLGEELALEKVRRNIWRYGYDGITRFDYWVQKFE